MREPSKIAQIVTFPKKLSLSLSLYTLTRPLRVLLFGYRRIRRHLIKMPEARDRIERPVDYSAIFVNRRSHGVLLDEPASRHSVSESPFQILPLDTQVNQETGSIGRGSLVGRGGIVRSNFTTWRPANRRLQSPFRVTQGSENTPMVSARRGRGRTSPSPLPSWYPRTPLRDITHVIRAIERRRGAGMGIGIEARREIEITTHQQVGVLESPVQGEHTCSMVTPGPSIGFKRSCPLTTAKVHKMLLDITKNTSKEEQEEAGFITPEKKLLNSIDKVEKIVMEEIQKLKSTPRAKREEREKRVRTLMSMR